MNFKDCFTFPLQVDSWCRIYVWDANRNVTFNYLNGDKLKNDDPSELIDLIDCINGEKPGIYNANALDGVIYIDDNKKLMIRGWGRLTGIGGLKLPAEEAARIQDEIVEYCVKMLRRDL